MIVTRGSVVSSLALAMTFAMFACGPSARRPGAGGGGGGGTVDSPFTCSAGATENAADTCSDGKDNDCDGLVDCEDPDCSGIGQCPVCGTVEHPTGTPVDLPDGMSGGRTVPASGGTPCTADSDCPLGEHCFDIPNGSNPRECRQSYVSIVNFSAFGATQTMAAASDIVSVCANMSHEWIRDLEIDLIAPSGQKIALDRFEGQSCSTGDCEVFLGHPLNTDDDCQGCTQEMGMDYCWTPSATKPSILQYANGNGTMDHWNSKDVLPPDNYLPDDPFSNLIGATLNGGWQLVVTDLWPQDAGKLHSWTISFNPAIVQNCSTPPIQ